MRPLPLLLPLVALTLAGCVLPTPDEFQEEQARFNREFAKNVRASVKALRGSPPRPIEEMRADATAQFNALERLRDETLDRLAELERNPNAGPDQRRYARNTAASIQMDRKGLSLRIDRQELASDDWRAIQRASIRFTNEDLALTQQLADTNRRLRRLDGSDSASSLGPISPAEQRLSDATEEVRAKATAATNEVETLHDEMIRILEAAAAAQDDDPAKKRATDAVTLARFTKRHDMDRLRGDIAAEEQWRIEGAISQAATIRDRLQAQIAAARQ